MDKRPAANTLRGQERQKLSIAKILTAIESAKEEEIEITNQYLKQTTGLRTRQLNKYKKVDQLKPYFVKLSKGKRIPQKNAKSNENGANIALVRALAKAQKEAAEMEEEIKKLRKRKYDKDLD
ncbi:hypothetical protein ACFSM5_07830 [Lacibacterium aquatile]|uniref:Uncharacterized protein n=1 Tax=Lacibacterium aquatile TaxID=1168082 RepID=A0ABW5DQR5_9PROT